MSDAAEVETDLDVVAHRVASTIAEPMPQSVARVVPVTAKRLGYVLVGICQHCTDVVIVRVRGESWVHRGHGIPSCLWNLGRHDEEVRRDPKRSREGIE